MKRKLKASIFIDVTTESISFPNEEINNMWAVISRILTSKFEFLLDKPIISDKVCPSFNTIFVLLLDALDEKRCS